jgi:glycosyltransferase involved in cell wall biosynthesis
MTAPEVSVVLPTWQRAHLLDDSIQSLLAEDGVALEVVVVDDGSTDDTAARVAAHPDRRVRFVRIDHAGVAAARNAGIAACRAPYVAFHDSDDRALAGRCARPVAYLRAHPEVDVVIQNGRMLPPDDAPHEPEAPWIAPGVARRLAAGPFGVEAVFRWNLGQLQGMCFTRRALDAAGPLDTRLTILDDLDLVLRVTTRFRAVFLDVPAFAYRRHAGGIARRRDVVREEAIRVADALVARHPEALAAIGPRVFRTRQAGRWARLAAARARAGDARGARLALEQARALAPWNLRLRLQGLRLGRRGA